MKKNLVLLLIIFTLHLVSFAENENKIQLAILLDTSSSMDGLIDQAKSKLWNIVNELANLRKNEKESSLEVAVYEYGKSSIPASEGYLRMVLGFTNDLDAVSEALFKLETNGGEEYCGQVIESALNSLQWDKGETFKLIFIAGNEPFNQGKIDYRKAVKEALSNGITVNTIFCGNYEEGIRTKWKDGAKLAGGEYINIDQNMTFVEISAPQDEEIMALNDELNKTYISYGQKGREKKERQEVQDKNAKVMSKSSFIQRAITKSSSKYKNSSWDMVDAVKEGQVNLEEVEADDLPEEMQKMSKEEKKEYIDKKEIKRKEIQAKIEKLKEDREKYINNEKKKMAENNEKNSLDSAIIKTIRKQAESKKFEYKK